MNLARFPRRRYTSGVTPLEFLPNLTKELRGPDIFIKRDDLLGLAWGGNKTRKLEFVMADVIESGADTVITTGAVQSNHCRLTLSAAVKEGLKCRLLLEERVPDSYNEYAVGNNLAFRLLGAEEISVVPGGSDITGKMESIAQTVLQQGGVPYIIPGGASNALGALGYVSCAQEMLNQSYEMSLVINHVICGSGSGGTHAGLVAGLFSNDAGCTVTGISVRANRHIQEDRVFQLANEVVNLAGGGRAVPKDQITVNDNFVGPGYSLPTKEMTKAIQLFAITEGIMLDPVYTGKAAAGLVSLVRSGRIAKGENVVFVHTGGSPALHAYPDAVYCTEQPK